jgi:predicted RNase H-like HicB family nuclease/uncharacterized damage-inducible protein DinB
MTVYGLYLESGPRRCKTQVHVLDLLGCIVQGATTEDALETSPEAIRTYLRFLQRHGEPVDPDGVFATAIVEHVMEGFWLGNGDPTPGFSFDFHPLEVGDLQLYLTRLAWIQNDTLELIEGLSSEQLVAQLEGDGRSIFHILEHVAGAHKEYLRMLVGKVEGATEALHAIQPDSAALPAALEALWQISRLRLDALTKTERQQHVTHGQTTWTARRCVRRMLEHSWEHLLEIAERLEGQVS